MRRVSDRLRTLSATRLAAPPVRPPDGGPDHASRAAGRPGRRQLLAARPRTLEAAGSSCRGGGPRAPHLPVLPDLAVGDQVAVTGHDLLAALAVAGLPFAAEQGVRDARPAR